MSDETIETPLMDELDSAEAEMPAVSTGAIFDGDLIPEPAQEVSLAPEPVLYDLMQIGKELEVTYSRIRRFAEAPGVAEALGAVRVKGIQGWRWPEASVGKWRQLIAEADKGLLTPKTAAAWLANQQTAPAEVPASASGNSSAAALVGLMGELALGSDENALAHVGPAQIVAAMMRLAEKLERNAEALTSAAPPKEPERWYTLTGAAEATGMSQKTIRENVPFVVEGSRKKWSGKDLAAYQERAERHTKL